MVVTRRQSAGPIPAVASRTNSSAGIPRPAKGKGVDKSSPLKESDAGPSHAPPNGTPSKPPPVGPQVLDDIKFDDDAPSAPTKSTPPKATPSKSKSKSKSKKSSKAKKHHSNKGISVFDIIARLFLVWFTVYTLSVCPEDVQLKSPVCRALTEYRRLFLEPYIYPPICTVLDHPSVAPHIQRAQPYYNRAVQVSTPWVRRGKREWRNRVVPQLEWFQLRARPYIRRAERQYDVTAGPYVRQVSNAAARYRLKAEPYVLSAALKTHQGWETAKPYVIPFWREAKRIPGMVVVYVGKPLGDARRQWVDPQVAKIWDAVVEQGKADTSKVKTASSSTTSRSTKVQSASVTGTTRSPSAPSVTEQSESSTPQATSTVSVDEVLEPSSDGASISRPPVPEPTDEAAISASSIVAESASTSKSLSNLATSTVPVDDAPEPRSEPISSSPPVIPEPTDEAALSASSIILESVSESPPSSSDAPVLIPSDVSGESSSPAQPPPPMDEEDADDLESFLSDLKLDEPEPTEAPPPPPEPEESEEEIAERRRLKAIETAETRAEIEGRHDQWEIDLEKFGKAQRKVVRATLTKLREAAAEEARAPGAAVRLHVESLVQEAERSLKSLKAYSRKLAAEDKPEREKVKTWDNVVSKVDKKFGERVDAAADGVREWWSAHITKENQEISDIAEEVMKLAHQAQSDIGMDYSWLSDVTYDDWQRYHRLVDKSKEFGELYLSMQNGSLPNAPTNPVSEIMESLQEEVDDLILGFEANLSRVKTAAIESFSKDSKPDAGSTKSDSESEPEVSILPIDPTTAKGKVWGVPPVILSRGAEEVEAAASRAEEAKTKAPHVEL